MLCTKCDTRNEDGARFCRVCGIALASPAPQTAYTLTTTPLNGPACPACSRQNPSGARFCVYCAAALAQPMQTMQPAPISYSAPVAQSALVNSSTTNVNINYGLPQPMELLGANSGNLVVRAIWFVLLGWWLGLLWTIFAWLFNLTLIGLPVGLMMLNAIPQVMTLRPRSSARLKVAPSGAVVVQQVVQHPLALRAIWFGLIGWWASLVWMIIAWVFSASLVLMPIGFWMFDRVPTITTLAAEQ